MLHNSKRRKRTKKGIKNKSRKNRNMNKTRGGGPGFSRQAPQNDYFPTAKIKYIRNENDLEQSWNQDFNTWIIEGETGGILYRRTVDETGNDYEVCIYEQLRDVLDDLFDENGNIVSDFKMTALQLIEDEEEPIIADAVVQLPMADARIMKGGSEIYSISHIKQLKPSWKKGAQMWVINTTGQGNYLIKRKELSSFDELNEMLNSFFIQVGRRKGWVIEGAIIKGKK